MYRLILGLSEVDLDGGMLIVKCFVNKSVDTLRAEGYSVNITEDSQLVFAHQIGLRYLLS